MPQIHETAYPRIKPDLSPRELEETYSLTHEELDFVFESARTTTTRLGLAVLLKRVSGIWCGFWLLGSL